MYMRIKSSNKIKLDSILLAQNVKCKVTKGRQILPGHPNLTYATTLLDESMTTSSMTYPLVQELSYQISSKCLSHKKVVTYKISHVCYMTIGFNNFYSILNHSDPCNFFPIVDAIAT